MNPLPTLLWLEFKRTAWVIYAALLGLALFAFILLALPGVLTGLDVLNLPVAGTATGSEQECVPPDCPSAGRSNVQLSRESSAHGSSFSWSFSRSWGGYAVVYHNNTQKKELTFFQKLGWIYAVVYIIIYNCKFLYTASFTSYIIMQYHTRRSRV